MSTMEEDASGDPAKRSTNQPGTAKEPGNWALNNPEQNFIRQAHQPVEPNLNRSCSAPAKFDSKSLFLYQENDDYAANFTKGFIPARMDQEYNQFYLNKTKEPSGETE
jgi:hypothetical protein